jgi:lysophospholipase L1-like esterase
VRTSGNRPLLAEVDVLSAAPRPVIVAFGDSITDNAGCANDAVPICRWGDVLGRRLAQAGKPQVVVTEAIAGNRVISFGRGPSAVDRFDRDVLALPGVTHVVILEGINDIGGSGRPRPDGTTAPSISYVVVLGGFGLVLGGGVVVGLLGLGVWGLGVGGCYFHRYATLSEDEARETGLSIWRSINLINLRENILPTRQRADLILRKGADHAVETVALRKL